MGGIEPPSDGRTTGLLRVQLASATLSLGLQAIVELTSVSLRRVEMRLVAYACTHSVPTREEPAWLGG